MVEADQGEGEESPEDEGVEEAREWALADDLGLAEDFPEEIPSAFADMGEMKAGIFARLEDLVEDDAETLPEEPGGGED